MSMCMRVMGARALPSTWQLDTTELRQDFMAAIASYNWWSIVFYDSRSRFSDIPFLMTRGVMVFCLIAASAIPDGYYCAPNSFFFV